MATGTAAIALPVISSLGDQRVESRHDHENEQAEADDLTFGVTKLDVELRVNGDVHAHADGDRPGKVSVARVSAQPSPTRRDSARADSAPTLATVEIRGSVSGLGKVRGANSVNRAELQSTIAGTSPLKAVERLPGVNFQAADPFGAYEWSTRFTIRGFQTGQIGQAFDGITLGDMTCGNFNGLDVGRAVDPENLEDVTGAQGSGALGTASSNNLGGVVQYASAEPRNERRFALRQMVGESNAPHVRPMGLRPPREPNAWSCVQIVHQLFAPRHR
jgi:TonB-dependent receptor-like protein